jgi:hypothetical protein
VSDAAVRLFKKDRMLFDEGGLLKAGGRRMVRGKVVVIEEQTGRKAHVWTVTKGAPITALKQVYADAGLDPTRDLLLIFNGKDWDAHGWRLSREAIDAALADGKRGFDENYAHGLVAALIALDLAVHLGEQRPPSKLPLIVFGGSVGAAAVVGGLAFTFWRRRQRAREDTSDS